MIEWKEVRPHCMKSKTTIPITVYRKLLHNHPDTIYMDIDLLGIKDHILDADNFADAIAEARVKMIYFLEQLVKEYSE